MRPPTDNQVDRAAATVAEIARTDGLSDGVVVFHPKGLGSPRWYPSAEFEAPLSEVWVPVPVAADMGEDELYESCRHKVEVALEFRQGELMRMKQELASEGADEAERKVDALLYDALPASRTV